MLTADQFEIEQAAEREKRLTLLRALRGKLAQALNDLAASKIPAKDIIAGVRLVNDQSRLEFRLTPPAEEELPAVTPPPIESADPLAGLRLYRPAG